MNHLSSEKKSFTEIINVLIMCVFVESFEIQSFNICNNGTGMKCWVKLGLNRSNMKTVLDEPENVGWNICS